MANSKELAIKEIEKYISLGIKSEYESEKDFCLMKIRGLLPYVK